MAFCVLLETLPYTIRILLEFAVRGCNGFDVKPSDVEHILNWTETSKQCTEIPFRPSRVLLQDFTGVPVAVDFAAMRDAMQRLGGDPARINPLVPADLVIDHSIQVDYSRSPDAVDKNHQKEFERNHERFAFLKWAAITFSNMLICPPGSGIVHQVNLEYLARVVFKDKDGLLYPDSLVGADSHTTMIDSLGVAGWGVGGIEAEAVMLGQPISMVLPEVVGFELTGVLPQTSTATDLVLTITHLLRKHGVVGKIVEFFGEGCRTLSVADRATVSNMCPEYGATMGFFAVDDQTLAYLKQTGRPEDVVDRVEKYLKAQGLFRQYDEADRKIRYSEDIIRLDLSTLKPCVAGPKRPQDKVLRFTCSMPPVVGFGLKPHDAEKVVAFHYNGTPYEFRHGSIAIAAITSCTNTSNPTVMLGAGLLAKAAVERGLAVKPYINTSLSPGSAVVMKYLQHSGLLPYLEALNFYLTGYGCQTCIGNSGGLDPEVAQVIMNHDFIAAAVLSGNRNFEGRVHPMTRANYLMSPILVVAYALAGRVDIDFETMPLGQGRDNQDVYLRDIFPTRDMINDVENNSVLPSMFKEVYQNLQQGGSQAWKDLSVPTSQLYPWSETSTYIHNPPFFQTIQPELQPIPDIKEAHCLLYLGDSVTTDHISPAGPIARDSPAATYLEARGVSVLDFNTYGSRRGNDEVMARGTFANPRLYNKICTKPGPFSVHFPSNEQLSVFEVAEKYKQRGQDQIIIAGKEYGSGSSRDWAAKGPLLLGVRAVLAESYERIHRSNLVGMGVLPLQFLQNQTPETFHIEGNETFSICLQTTLEKPRQLVVVRLRRKDGREDTFQVQTHLDTEVELLYFKNGGILHYTLRKLLHQKS